MAAIKTRRKMGKAKLEKKVQAKDGRTDGNITINTKTRRLHHAQTKGDNRKPKRNEATRERKKREKP